MLNAGERLRRAIEEGIAAQTTRDEPTWYVTFDEPLTRMFCDEGARDHVAVFAALLSNGGVMCHMLPTDVEGVACVECDEPIYAVCLREQFMKAFMSVVRRNGAHGRYTGDGKRWYEF